MIHGKLVALADGYAGKYWVRVRRGKALWLQLDNSTILHGIQEKLAHFEGEFPKLNEATITLELAQWKLGMTENKNIHQELFAVTRRKPELINQKFKINQDVVIRQTCIALSYLYEGFRILILIMNNNLYRPKKSYMINVGKLEK